MDAAYSYFERRTNRQWNADALKDLSALTPRVQAHLQRVYISLCGALLVAATGVFAHMMLNLGGILSSLGLIGCIVWLSSTPPLPSNQTFRLKLFLGIAFLQGCTVGPLVQSVIETDSSIVLQAFLATSTVFGCFSASALLAKRREFLFLGGIISSALSVFAMMRFASFFLGGRATVFQLELYGGLLVFIGYILFDTQLMVEKAIRGDNDYVKHALELLIDFVAIFVRILIIMAKNSSKKESRERREKKSGSYR